jgi:hypothetical protein
MVLAATEPAHTYREAENFAVALFRAGAIAALWTWGVSIAGPFAFDINSAPGGDGQPAAASRLHALLGTIGFRK